MVLLKKWFTKNRKFVRISNSLRKLNFLFQETPISIQSNSVSIEKLISPQFNYKSHLVLLYIIAYSLASIYSKLGEIDFRFFKCPLNRLAIPIAHLHVHFSHFHKIFTVKKKFQARKIFAQIAQKKNSTLYNGTAPRVPSIHFAKNIQKKKKIALIRDEAVSEFWCGFFYLATVNSPFQKSALSKRWLPKIFCPFLRIFLR